MSEKEIKGQFKEFIKDLSKDICENILNKDINKMQEEHASNIEEYRGICEELKGFNEKVIDTYNDIVTPISLLEENNKLIKGYIENNNINVKIDDGTKEKLEKILIEIEDIKNGNIDHKCKKDFLNEETIRETVQQIGIIKNSEENLGQLIEELQKTQNSIVVSTEVNSRILNSYQYKLDELVQQIDTITERLDKKKYLEDKIISIQEHNKNIIDIINNQNIVIRNLERNINQSNINSSNILRKLDGKNYTLLCLGFVTIFLIVMILLKL